jgi:hypothetical protein
VADRIGPRLDGTTVRTTFYRAERVGQ